MTDQITVPAPDAFDEDKFPFGVPAGENKLGMKDCPTCRKPPTKINRQGWPPEMFLFVDRLSAQEYRISGMCQKCQDSAFNYYEEDYE